MSPGVPIRVLALDIEGGHGGSSRSLFHALSAINPRDVQAEVWCRRSNWLEAAYAEFGIDVGIEPAMPSFTVLTRDSRNAYDLCRFFGSAWSRSEGFRQRLLERVKQTDLIHLNHISLFWLARWLKKQSPNLPISMHIRTQPYDTFAGRWQQRTAAQFVDRFVFITENERDHFQDLAGKTVDGHVIFNPVPNPDAKIEAIELQKPPGGLAVALLSSFSFQRGIDRLVDIALALDRINDQKVKFFVAGDMTLPSGLPGKLGAFAGNGATLEGYVAAEGLKHRFEFLGYLQEPERLLKACDVLVKPTREDNPWGRDILEAMANALPVASVGAYTKFVETGETGYLQQHFDADALAVWLSDLANNRVELAKLGSQARARIVTNCAPEVCGEALTQFWSATASECQKDANNS